ncbi:MAG: VWA domain-containing protein [Fuerstiella sp.]
MLGRAAIVQSFGYPVAMLSFFLNPLLLLGLAGIALPVFAHLLSRRKFDVVQWGAMQFLDVSRKTRRKLKLEELLLLLVRVSAIALIALALARPWISSGFLTGYQSAGSRDIVLVIDGSNSMSRSDGVTSLHDRAKRRATEFLETLQPGDTAAVIDVRDKPVRVIGSPIQDLETVAAAIAKIPAAGGSGELQSACEDAVGILGRCSNGHREIIVLTDRQRVGWNVGSDAAWKRFEDVLQFPSVKPKVWVVDVGRNSAELSRNVAVGRLNLSRDLSVPDFPVQFQVTLRNTGATKVSVPVSVLVDGQRLAAMEGEVVIDPNSEALFSRSVQLANQGTHLITVEANLTGDSIPADNVSSASLQIQSAIPVMLIESSNSLRASSQDSFFAKMALTATENKSPWVVAEVVKTNDLTVEMLKKPAAFVLANVDGMAADVMRSLQAEVANGKGLFVALGSRTTPEVFESLYSRSGFFPGLALDRIRTATPNAETPMTIAPYSLDVSWLTRFRNRKGASFLEAGFAKWWLLKRTEAVAEAHTGEPAVNDAENLDANFDGAAPSKKSDSNHASRASTLQTIAVLATGDPLLLQGRYGQGPLLLMTSGLDVSWNQLPAKPDYVPFLHEAVFQMASSRTIRNVDFADPLRTVMSNDVLLKGNAADASSVEAGFLNPADEFVMTAGEVVDAESIFQFSDTRLPGVYELKTAKDGDVLDAFVVNYDHSEHDPESLTIEDKERLTVDDRLKFVDSMDALGQQMYRDESRSELWAVLLWVFLGLLVVEVWMTRRMVQQGYADHPEASTASAA